MASTITAGASLPAWYDLGDTATLTVEVKADGVLANAGSMALVVTTPTGTTSNPSVTNSSTGTYTATYVTTAAGRHSYVWTATGANAGVYASSFSVVDTASAYQPLVSLEDSRTHLRVTTTASDEALRRVLLVASDLVERFTGQTWRRQSVTETYSGGDGSFNALALRTTPVVSITSVTESGDALTSADYTLDSVSGILHRGDTDSYDFWAGGQHNITIVYLVGASVIPPAIQQAVLELAGHLWDTQRGGSGLPRNANLGDDWDPRLGYSIPRRVAEMLDRYRAPGFA